MKVINIPSRLLLAKSRVNARRAYSHTPALLLQCTQQKNRAALTARPLTRLKVRLLHLLDGVGDLTLGGSDRHLLTCTVTQ